MSTTDRNREPTHAEMVVNHALWRPRPSAVAIPVRNEADRIGDCLRALSNQVGGIVPDHVVLLVNNTTDATIEVAERLRPSLRYRLTIVRRDYPPALAHAGHARADAMRIAAALVGDSGLLLTTDADGRVAPDWFAANLAAMADGADVVCGRAEIDPVEALLIPAHLHADDAREQAYGTLIDHIHALADPDPYDPWPRHSEHSGASILTSVAAWTRAGGIPMIRNAEDRAFLQALRRTDHRIRHAPEVRVTVSGRIVGRACGGMAETIARRIGQQDTMLDPALEPAPAALRRARARAARRRLHKVGSFGAAWDDLESASPMLVRRPVARAELARHMAVAEWIVGRLQKPERSSFSEEKEAKRLLNV